MCVCVCVITRRALLLQVRTSNTDVSATGIVRSDPLRDIKIKRHSFPRNCAYVCPEPVLVK